MKSPSPPQAPDPIATSKAQTTSNVQTAQANTALSNANEIGPTGSVNYKVTGYQQVGDQKIPTYTKTTALSPQQQKLYDQQTGLGSQMNTMAKNQLTRLDGSLSKPITLDGLPSMPKYDRQHYEDALMQRMNPQLERDRAAMDSKLATQGVMPGSEAYREAVALSDRQANDARYQAILNGGTYAEQEMSTAGTARERALQEQMAVRNQPLNEISALMSGGQVTMPQFTQYRPGNVGGTDVQGNIWNSYNAQMQGYNAQQQNRNAMLGGIGGLLGSGAQLMMGGLG